MKDFEMIENLDELLRSSNLSKDLIKEFIARNDFHTFTDILKIRNLIPEGKERIVDCFFLNSDHELWVRWE